MAAVVAVVVVGGVCRVGESGVLGVSGGGGSVLSEELRAGSLLLPDVVAADDPPLGDVPGGSEYERPVDEEAERPSPFFVTLRGGGDIALRADLRSRPGSVAVYRAGGGVGIGAALSRRVRVGFDADTEWSGYNFSGASGLVPGTGRPVRDVYRTTFSPRLTYIQSETWAFTVAGLVDISGEAGANVGDSITGGGFVVVRHQFNEDFSVSFGVGAKSRLERDPLVVPALRADIRITDRVRFVTEGLGARLEAELTETLSAHIRGEWQLREYRLDDRGALPEGIVRDSRVPVGLGIDWRPVAGVTLSATGGAVVWQQYRFDDRSGNKVSSVETRPAPYVSLGGEVRF